MKADALFLNGIYEEPVLQEILEVQTVLPEQIMFLQPYKCVPIARLRDDPPSVGDPMRLLISTTDDLPTVRYAAEVVGWDDKRQLAGDRHQVLSRLIRALQPKQGGLYSLSQADDGESVNLLHLWRLSRLQAPFSVARLVNATDGQPLSAHRSRAGGWVYVKGDSLAQLLH